MGNILVIDSQVINYNLNNESNKRKIERAMIERRDGWNRRLAEGREGRRDSPKRILKDVSSISTLIHRAGCLTIQNPVVFCVNFPNKYLSS